MVAGQWCGFPDGWTSSTMPYGDPACIHYKGSQSQRIAELIKRGSGSHQIDEWNKWYEDQATAVRVDAVIKSRLAVVDAERAAEAAIQLQREQTIYDAGVKEAQRLQKVAEDKRLQEIKDQQITFNEQTNSGDFNETPITDINLNNGYHNMPDGSLMKDSDMENKSLNNNMKMAGIAAIGIIALLVVKK
jgi:hypothetical protein